MNIAEVIKYIRPELLVLVPVIYFIGMALKNSKVVNDNLIPLILGIIGIVLSIVYVLGTSDIKGWQGVITSIFSGVTQGILCAGCSVYVNQTAKQLTKDGTQVTTADTKEDEVSK